MTPEQRAEYEKKVAKQMAWAQNQLKKYPHWLRVQRQAAKVERLADPEAGSRTKRYKKLAEERGVTDPDIKVLFTLLGAVFDELDAECDLIVRAADKELASLRKRVKALEARNGNSSDS